MREINKEKAARTETEKNPNSKRARRAQTPDPINEPIQRLIQRLSRSECNTGRSNEESPLLHLLTGKYLDLNGLHPLFRQASIECLEWFHKVKKNKSATHDFIDGVRESWRSKFEKMRHPLESPAGEIARDCYLRLWLMEDERNYQKQANAPLSRQEYDEGIRRSVFNPCRILLDCYFDGVLFGLWRTPRQMAEKGGIATDELVSALCTVRKPFTNKNMNNLSLEKLAHACRRLKIGPGIHFGVFQFPIIDDSDEMWRAWHNVEMKYNPQVLTRPSIASYREEALFLIGARTAYEILTYGVPEDLSRKIHYEIYMLYGARCAGEWVIDEAARRWAEEILEVLIGQKKP